MKPCRFPLAALAFALAGWIAAPASAQPATGWQTCAAEREREARLACFDRWAASQQPAAAPAAAAASPTPPVPPVLPAQTATAVTAAAARAEESKSDLGCHSHEHSELSRFWELEPASGCGIFGIRSYRPISLSLIGADSVNRQPTSGNPLNNATTAQPYRTTETRIQLSVRSKLAEGLLTEGPARRDSLWFGYTQQSYWQLFTGAVSRPFRNTDHEPEIMYIYPVSPRPVAGWQLRYAGVGVVHQSNGQSLPLSRSWNRTYLMAGAEHSGGLTLQGRLWRRFDEDKVNDDNPGISNYIGRAELTAGWLAENGHNLRFTLRSSLRSASRGSARLEWLVPVGKRDVFGQPGALRIHTQIFTGYGDSLIDYNRKRSVLSIGMSLVDW